MINTTAPITIPYAPINSTVIKREDDSFDVKQRDVSVLFPQQVSILQASSDKFRRSMHFHWIKKTNFFIINR